MHRTIVRYCHITIGRHLEHFTLLRITIDIDDHLIARTQHVVLGGGNVHLGFKRELLVIEDITTKDLLTLLLLLTEIEGVGTLIQVHHRRVIAVHPLRGTIHHHLLLTGFPTLLRIVNLLQRTIVLTHTTLGITNGLIGCLTHARLLQLTGILLTHLLDLLKRGALLKELRGYLRLLRAFLTLLHHKLENLRLGHSLAIGHA